MNEHDIKRLIEKGLSGSQAFVSGDGTHFEATVICHGFEGKSMLERHRMVYSTLGDGMQGAIHALSIRAYTPLDWDKSQKPSSKMRAF
ncbi:MAG TPA: BolA/IbaG family iron-sulfur metabolism protein [Gammaproteobacteria bacterium]